MASIVEFCKNLCPSMIKISSTIPLSVILNFTITIPSIESFFAFCGLIKKNSG